MVFSSVIFLCMFLPAVLAGYYILPRRCRNVFLLVASLVFYACGGLHHLIYLVLSIVINFLFGVLIYKTGSSSSAKKEEGPYHPALQKIILIVAVTANVGSLIYFKYTGMLIETLNSLNGGDKTIPDIILPLGISFYTFQCMSYIIDVYRKEPVYTPNLISFALYIAMFPQLLQGPIIRYKDVKERLDNPGISRGEFTRGIERFIVGLAKKVIIANTLGEVADKIFAVEPANMTCGIAWLGALLYTLQIYFDFSGYTDMAIGLGHMFGFTFRENFNYPYISRSVTEFWRRWHISLSNWFRDYLYIPLGGSRRGNVYINLLIVFLATGIWHGAAWGFLVWGLWHGLFMLIERAFRNKKTEGKLPAALADFLGWAYTTLAVMLGWVLFKIEDIGKALSYIKVMFIPGHHDYDAFAAGFFLDARLAFFLVIALIACVPWAQVLPRHLSVRIACLTGSEDTLPRVIRHVLLVLLLVISYIFIVNSTYTPFIYFQF